jgi:hypothetical protein
METVIPVAVIYSEQGGSTKMTKADAEERLECADRSFQKRLKVTRGRQVRHTVANDLNGQPGKSEQPKDL